MSIDLHSWSSSSSESPASEEVSDFSLPEDENGESENVKICQYAHRVLDFSSQYGSDTSISYTAFNIIGRQAKYPDYGDFPETYAMVSRIGFLSSLISFQCQLSSLLFLSLTFWGFRADSLSFSLPLQRTYGRWWECSPGATNEIMSQNVPEVAVQDFIVVEFEEYVIPHAITIYETYNPGSVINIWAYVKHTEEWMCLWSGPPSRTERHSRRFSPPIKRIKFPTK